MPLFVLTACAYCLTGSLGLADQRDPRLDALFARVKVTTDEHEAARIDREIWSIWLQSGDAETDRILEQGTVAMATQVWSFAETAFNLVVQRLPNFAEGWNKRATLFYLMDRYDESIRDCERTLALEPRHYGALSGMGLIEVARDRLPEALEWFQRALAVNPHLEGVRAIAQELEAKIKGRPI